MTSTVADSSIDISSRALILIGAEPITSFTDGSTESLVASNLYEDICRSALSNTRWRFATNQAVLNRLTDAPTGRYDHAYQLPSDTLIVHAVTVNDLPIGYQIYGDMVYADTSTSDSVIADYSFRATEENFPSYFTIALQYALASAFASSIARDMSLMQMMSQMADQAMLKARNIDSQQQTTRTIPQTRFAITRRS
tara:strand:- start:10338 stop:10925 length:588 start_codon:yes stop_codon:yes gene_type:complete